MIIYQGLGQKCTIWYTYIHILAGINLPICPGSWLGSQNLSKMFIICWTLASDSDQPVQTKAPDPIQAYLPPVAAALTAVSHQQQHAGSLLIDCLLLTASHLSRISWVSKWGDKPMSPCATLGACARPAAKPPWTIIHLVTQINLIQIKLYTNLTFPCAD